MCKPSRSEKIDEWYVKYKTRLKRFLQSRTNVHDAEEILQATWEKLLEDGLPEDHPNVKAFIFTTAKHLLIDQKRSRKRRRMILELKVFPFITAQGKQDLSASFHAEKELEQMLKKFRECLAKLPEPDQTIVEHKITAVKQKDTAKKFDRSEPWVSNRAKAAIQRVAKCVQSGGA